MTEQMPEYPSMFDDAIRERANRVSLQEELRTTKMMVALLVRKFGKDTMEGGYKVTLSDMELMEAHPDPWLTVWKNADYRTTEIEVW